MPSYKKALKYILPVFIWAVVIFLFSNRPSIKTVDFYLGDFILKKSAHLIEYGIFSTLIYRALVNYGVDKKKAMILSVLSAFLYGATDEFHQSYIYGRTATIRDVLIDTSGALISVYGLILNLKKLPKFLKVAYSRLDIRDIL